MHRRIYLHCFDQGCGVVNKGRDPVLLPGTSVEVEVIVDARKDVLLLPNETSK